MRRKKPNYKDLTKNIFSDKSARTSLASRLRSPKQNSLRKHLLEDGILCKDCHKYLARARFSVCKRCYEKRVMRLVKSGGFQTLTPKLQKEIDQELQVPYSR